MGKIGEGMKNEVPKFLLKLDFMMKSVAFIAAFSILFMLIYTPFSVTAWFDNNDVPEDFTTGSWNSNGQTVEIEYVKAE